MSPTKTKAQVLEEFRIQTIQEAAARVIGRDGLGATTMQAIAKEAGIAKGTIYLYFRDRNDLVERTADHALARLATKVDEVLTRQGPFVENLRRLLTLFVEYFESNRDFFRIYLAVRYPSGEAEDKTRHQRAELPPYQVYLDHLSHFFGQAMDSGEIRRTDAERLALFISEGVNSILLRRLQETESPPAELEVDQMMDMILFGISNPDATP